MLSLDIESRGQPHRGILQYVMILNADNKCLDQKVDAQTDLFSAVPICLNPL